MSQPDVSERQSSVSLLDVLAALVRSVRWLALGALIGGVVAAGYSLVVAPRYEATTRFAPGDPALNLLPGGLASLASQFGAGGLSGGTRSLQFYADVVKSPDLLRDLALDSFPDPKAPASRRPLVDLLPVSDDSLPYRLADAVEYLQDHAVSTTVNDRTGTVGLTVVMPSAELAAAVATRLYGELEAFNYEMRRSAAATRRIFAERELARARSELQTSEAELRHFLEANRGGLDVPRLAFQRARLQRRIDVAQVVYSQMTQELTEARIAESRDTPVFTVIQRATIPLRRSWPNRTRTTILGAIAGGVLAGVIVVLVRTRGVAFAVDPSGYGRFREAIGRRTP